MAIFLSVLMLFQGCTVYKSVPVSFEEAVMADTKVKMKKHDGQKVKYHRIVKLDDGNFYGVEKVNEMFNYRLIVESDFHNLKVKDNSTSTILSIAIPVTIIGLIVGGVAIALDGGGFPVGGGP